MSEVDKDNMTIEPCYDLGFVDEEDIPVYGRDGDDDPFLAGTHEWRGCDASHLGKWPFTNDEELPAFGIWFSEYNYKPGKTEKILRQFYLDPDSFGTNLNKGDIFEHYDVEDEYGEFARSLYGAYLYSADDFATQLKGAYLTVYHIQDTASTPTIAPRVYAVILLEGLVCDRNPQCALGWLHFAAKLGDFKALRILVYALFGVERLLVTPRIGAKKDDSPGRTMRISDLFQGVDITDRDRLRYLRMLINLEIRSACSRDGYGYMKAVKLTPLGNDRRFLGLLFGYVLLARKVEPETLSECEFLSKYIDDLKKAIEKEPLYDGIIIKEKMLSEEQLKILEEI